MRFVWVAVRHNEDLSEEIVDFFQVSVIIRAEPHLSGSGWVHLLVRTRAEVPTEILV